MRAKIPAGSRVSFRSLVSDRVFYATIIRHLSDDWAIVRDNRGDRPVRSVRLNHIPYTFAGKT